MSRTIPAAIDADLDDRFLIPVFFVALDFDTDPLYLHTDIGTISVLSQTWQGAGGLGSISPIEETTEFASPGVKFRLQLTDESAGSIYEEITQQDFYQREVVIYFATRDISTGLLAADPFEIQRYKMDVPEITYGGGSAFVDLVVESEFLDGKRSNGEMYSKAQLRSEQATDEGFDFIAILPQVKITWGASKTVSLGGSGQPPNDLPPGIPDIG